MRARPSQPSPGSFSAHLKHLCASRDQQAYRLLDLSEAVFATTWRVGLLRDAAFVTASLLACLTDAAFVTGWPLACLREAAFAAGSRPPTWVTYSPVTSVPRTMPVSTCSPGFEPSFQVRAALPFASLTARAGLTVPDFTEKFTRASGTGFP